ncbi:MAG TPA: hypothetical protein DC047_17095 [Blastocatellia bacterium]|nr:hypothetical protein [Blastocatellia bacterium]
MKTFTQIHVAISLIAIFAGLVVMFGLLTRRRLDRWTALFLSMTVLTSVTGFFFPFHGLTPAITVGIISMLVLAVALFARYARRLTSPWRGIYVITAMLALYLNVFVLIVQSFQNVPFLKALAPTQSEPPFLLAQLLALALFIVLTIVAAIRFRVAAAS